jgi:hypothetical protein
MSVRKFGRFGDTSSEHVGDVCGWGSVQANIEYLYIRSYGQTASVTSNLRVYSLTKLRIYGKFGHFVTVIFDITWLDRLVTSKL